MNLALFDFDGTITNKDAFTGFLFYAISPRRLLLGKVLLAPFIIGHKLGLVDGASIRKKIVRIGFSGRCEKDLTKQAQKYSKEKIDKTLRINAMEKLAWHKKQGDKIVVVSASIDIYLKDWCERYEVELLCSRLERKKGKITGRYIGADCSCEEKVSRIKESLDLNLYDKIYAYGDTKEDLAMLELAHEKYFQWCLV